MESRGGGQYGREMGAGWEGEGGKRKNDRNETGGRLKSVTDLWNVKTDAQEPEEILAPKTVSDSERARAAELGAALAEGIAQGIF